MAVHVNGLQWKLKVEKKDLVETKKMPNTVAGHSRYTCLKLYCFIRTFIVFWRKYAEQMMLKNSIRSLQDE